ncbi:MAG TPA: aspartate 1-decarboxylase [Allocoleopsis sp.]
MYKTVLGSKIHNCAVTDANLNYMGSISIDEKLLKEAGIVPYEQVQVVNINNGERFITYAIVAEAESGIIALNGAAARLGMKGDRIIIMTYITLDETEIKNYTPTVIIVDENNHIK